MKRARPINSGTDNCNSLLHKLRVIETFGNIGPSPIDRILPDPSSVSAYRINIDDIIDVEGKIKRMLNEYIQLYVTTRIMFWHA